MRGMRWIWNLPLGLRSALFGITVAILSGLIGVVQGDAVSYFAFGALMGAVMASLWHRRMREHEGDDRTDTSWGEAVDYIGGPISLLLAALMATLFVVGLITERFGVFTSLAGAVLAIAVLYRIRRRP